MTRLPRRAPIADTPTAPPRLRKKAIDELPDAEHAGSGSTFCTTSTRFCMIMPMPTPRTNMKTASSNQLRVVADGAHQRHADGQQHAAGDDVPLPDAGAADDLADTGRGDSRPAIIGMVSRPDSVGVLPRASCMYWLRKTEVPNIATPTETLAMIASTTRAVAEQAASGMIGSRDPALDARRASDQQASSAADHAARSARTAQANCWPPRVTQMSSSETDGGDQRGAEVVDAHRRSRRGGRCSVFCRTTMASAAIGTPT